MGDSIKTIIRENSGEMQPGDVFVIETPGGGGHGVPVTANVRKTEPLNEAKGAAIEAK